MTEAPAPHSPDPAPSNTAPDPALAARSDQSPPATPPSKPEGIPDRYWDPTTGLRAKEAAEVLARVEADSAKFKDFPEKVDKAADFYKLPEQMLPEGVKLPEGMKLEPDTALLGQVLPILHKHRADPALFQDLARAVTAQRLEQRVAAEKEFAEDAKKLGANGETRRKALAERIVARVGPDRAKFLDTAGLTSQAVEFFESLLTDTTSAPLVPRRDNTPPPAPASAESRWYPGQSTQRA